MSKIIAGGKRVLQRKIQGTEWWYNVHNYLQKSVKLTANDDKRKYLTNLIHSTYISYNVQWFVEEKSDMVKHELRVTSYELKAYEFKFTSCEFKSATSKII